jgi:Ca2+-transporting ATPase
MIFSSTLLTRGSAEAVVTDIGLASEIGKISRLVMELKSPPTPLQIELSTMGKQIGILVLALCALIFMIGLLRGIEPIELFFTIVSLSVAAVPEGLPAIVTICLALGVQQMIKKNALIRKLDAVETLGNVNVICADKTGTITENKMKVTEFWLQDSVTIEQLARAGSSCNRAELPDIGDPTEIALLKFAKEKGTQRLDLENEDVPFTSEAKYMLTSHMLDGKTIRYYKGAPEVIATFLSPEDAKHFRERSEEYSKAGLRVLGVAQDDGEGPYGLGLLAMMDPPRARVKEAIQIAADAGITTYMITGDHPATALAIARAVGISSSGVIEGTALETMKNDDIRLALKTISVFARVHPKHKVKILEALQEDGNIVAMSGDGVNDAPALKRAHVGIGMGLKGTDVAREASAMVLTDDDYSTIVAAIAEGRRIYDNIKKFVIFLMRSNIGEVMTIAGAMVLGMPLPLLPLHILWVNLVTDSLPALALAGEPPEKGIMTRPPRKKGVTIFTGEWTLLVVAGVLNAVLSLTAFQIVLLSEPSNIDLARTAALTTTIIFQLFLACSTRSKQPVWVDPPHQNKWLILAILASVGLHLLLLFTPLSALFQVTAIPIILWEEIIGGSIVAFILFEICKWMQAPKLVNAVTA